MHIGHIIHPVCWYHSYTEHQKKLITSSVRRSLKSTASKLIILETNKLTPWKEYLKNTRFSRVRKERTRLNHERSFFENRKNCSPSELHRGSLCRTFNSYSFSFNGGLRKHHTGFCLLRTPSPWGKQFLWFLKIISSMIKGNFFFAMCLLRINLPNLCPNMIHVDALDFSGWHSKEVTSFF